MLVRTRIVLLQSYFFRINILIIFINKFKQIYQFCKIHSINSLINSNENIRNKYTNDILLLLFVSKKSNFHFIKEK